MVKVQIRCHLQCPKRIATHPQSSLQSAHDSLLSHFESPQKLVGGQTEQSIGQLEQLSRGPATKYDLCNIEDTVTHTTNPQLPNRWH